MTISGSWRRLGCCWRVLRSRIRREGAALALLTLLSLGLFEPLICILHCHFWIPFALQHHIAGQQHDHHHMHVAGATGAVAATPVASRATAAPAALPDGCALHTGPLSGAPIPPPPSPVHEVALSLVLPILLVLLVITRLDASLTGPPRVYPPLPLRPPIPIAG